MHDGCCDYAGTWFVTFINDILAIEETPARQEQEGGGQAEASCCNFAAPERFRVPGSVATMICILAGADLS